MNRVAMVVVTGIILLIVAIITHFVSGSTEVASAGAEAVKKATESEPWFGTLFALGALILIIWAVVNFLTSPGPWRTRVHSCVPPVWGFVVLIGLTTIHWLLWIINPEMWDAWQRSNSFWPMNFAAAMAVWFCSQANRTIRIVGYVLATLLIFAIGRSLIVSASNYIQAQTMDRLVASNQVATPQPVFSARVMGLPAEVVLPIIAQCESNGRQFDDQNNLVTNPTTSAVGKYQIIASLHEERATSLGFDIRTEEGNEAYARQLFKESGTEHWEVDQKSKACWEPKLFQLAGLPPTTQRVVVKAKREWSEPISFPTGRLVDWTPRTATAYQIRVVNGEPTTFPAVTQTPIAVPTLAPWFKVRAVDADSVQIDFVHYVPR